VVSQYLVVAKKADRTEYKTYGIPVESNRRLILNTLGVQKVRSLT